MKPENICTLVNLGVICALSVGIVATPFLFGWTPPVWAAVLLAIVSFFISVYLVERFLSKFVNGVVMRILHSSDKG